MQINQSINPRIKGDLLGGKLGRKDDYTGVMKVAGKKIHI